LPHQEQLPRPDVPHDCRRPDRRGAGVAVSCRRYTSRMGSVFLGRRFRVQTRRRSPGLSAALILARTFRSSSWSRIWRRILKGGGPEIMAAFRDAAIGLLRATGATKIAETLRRNASQVGSLFTKLGIFKK